MSTSHQVGAVTSSENAQGTQCRIVYYVLDSEKASYLPVRGTAPDWIPSEYANRNLRVTDIGVEGIGPNWIITITADNYPAASPDGNADEYLRHVLWNYPQGDIVFLPKWYGADIAGQQKDWRTQQLTRKLPSGSKVTGGGSTSEDVQIIDQHWYLHVFSTVDSLTGSLALTPTEDVAGAESYVFKNASPLIITRAQEQTTNYAFAQIINFGPDAAKGTPSYKFSPFKGGESDPELPIKWIGQTIQMITAQVKYYVRQRQASIAVWQGVNGESGAFPARVRPFDVTAYKWLAAGQTINEFKDSDGDTWCEVTRSMKYAPGALLWDPDKNHGEWTW